MSFDLCDHQKKQIIIDAAILRRKELGMPIEKNISLLYAEMSSLLGIQTVIMDSRTANHLPSPAEMKDEKGDSILPSKDCPKCGGKSVFPMSVCTSCQDWKDGFRSSWSCINKECGYKELLTTPYTQLLDEVAPGWKGGFKKIVQTDQGVKGE